MNKEKIMLWQPEKNIHSYIRPYLIDTNEPRGAVLILPGGGYRIVCEPSEGAPVAKKFNSLGLHAFVLNYRVEPNTFPSAQIDAMRALQIIRANAAKWNIKPNVVGTCGFSAGGHLSASLGSSLVDNVQYSGGDEADNYKRLPDFIISGQGVLSFRERRNEYNAMRLLGKSDVTEVTQEEMDTLAVEYFVTEKTPPCFIWHTFADKVVPFTSSIYFAEALRKHNVPCQLQIFARGDHGILLGLDTPDVSNWPELAAKFIAEYTSEEPTPQEHYTHFYQCDATGTYPGELREE